MGDDVIKADPKVEERSSTYKATSFAAWSFSAVLLNARRNENSPEGYGRRPDEQKLEGRRSARPLSSASPREGVAKMRANYAGRNGVVPAASRRADRSNPMNHGVLTVRVSSGSMLVRTTVCSLECHRRLAGLRLASAVAGCHGRHNCRPPVSSMSALSFPRSRC
uniref:Uncharacterized protein n=1 Tax=Trichuris muris TaxID=70415 RepID=A0A5S6Q8B4_TRIMR